MTSNTLKAQAREYQAQHPGTGYAEALRAVRRPQPQVLSTVAGNCIRTTSPGRPPIFTMHLPITAELQTTSADWIAHAMGVPFPVSVMLHYTILAGDKDPEGSGPFDAQCLTGEQIDAQDRAVVPPRTGPNVIRLVDLAYWQAVFTVTSTDPHSLGVQALRLTEHYSHLGFSVGRPSTVQGRLHSQYQDGSRMVESAWVRRTTAEYLGIALGSSHPRDWTCVRWSSAAAKDRIRSWQKKHPGQAFNAALPSETKGDREDGFAVPGACRCLVDCANGAAERACVLSGTVHTHQVDQDGLGGVCPVHELVRSASL